MRRRKRGNIFTKLVVLGLAVYASITLLTLHGQILNAQETKAQLEQSVTELERSNAIYEREIENRYDPEMIERIARDRLGLIMPGERTFHSITN